MTDQPVAGAHGERHPLETGQHEIAQFLSALAIGDHGIVRESA